MATNPIPTPCLTAASPSHPDYAHKMVWGSYLGLNDVIYEETRRVHWEYMRFYHRTSLRGWRNAYINKVGFSARKNDVGIRLWYNLYWGSCLSLS